MIVWHHIVQCQHNFKDQNQTYVLLEVHILAKQNYWVVDLISSHNPSH